MIACLSQSCNIVRCSGDRERILWKGTSKGVCDRGDVLLVAELGDARAAQDRGRGTSSLCNEDAPQGFVMRVVPAPCDRRDSTFEGSVESQKSLLGEYRYISELQENVIKRNQVEHTKTERNVLEAHLYCNIESQPIG